MLEYVAQVGAALGAQGFGAQHAVGTIDFFSDRVVSQWLVKAGPATTRVKLGVGRKQGRTAANAGIGATFPMVFITPREGALGGCAASDVESQRLGALVGQQFSPGLIGGG